MNEDKIEQSAFDSLIQNLKQLLSYEVIQVQDLKHATPRTWEKAQEVHEQYLIHRSRMEAFQEALAAARVKYHSACYKFGNK